MKNTYPVVMTQGEKFVVVFIPDFKIDTQGKNIAEALEMARDAIGLMGIDMEDDGEEIPAASDMEEVKKEAAAGAIFSLVEVDFEEYRRQNEKKDFDRPWKKM